MIILNEIELILLSFTTGFLLGIFFFIGLWWTVKKVLFQNASATLVLGSLFARTGLVLLGFYLLANFSLSVTWLHWIVSLFGFFIARFTVKQLVVLMARRNYAS